MKEKNLKKMKSQDVSWMTIRLDQLEKRLTVIEKEVSNAKVIVKKLKKRWMNT